MKPNSTPLTAVYLNEINNDTAVERSQRLIESCRQHLVAAAKDGKKSVRIYLGNPDSFSFLEGGPKIIDGFVLTLDRDMINTVQISW